VEEFKKIFTQTAWQVGGRFFGIIASFIVLGIVTHHYGKEGTGIFTQASTYLAFFFLVADLGLNGYFLPRLQQHPYEANQLFNFRLLWSGVLILLVFLLTPLLPFGNSQFNLAVYLGAITILLSSITANTSLIFQAKLRYDLSNLAGVIGAFSMIPVILCLNYLKVPVSFLIIVTIVGWLINNIFSLLLVKKLYQFKIEKVNFSFITTTLKYAWPITLTLLLNTVYFRIDSFILTSAKSFTEVGIYNVAYQVFQNAITIPTFIMNSFYPMMIMLFHENRKKFFYQLKIAAAGLFFLSLIGVVFTYFLSPWIINILAGPGFEGSNESLKVLAFGFPAYFLTALLMWVFVLLGKQKIMFWVYLFGLIFNVITNLIFIPQYSYLAASWITGISEYLILVLQLGILWKAFRSKYQ